MLPKSKRLNLKKNFKFVADGRKIYTQSFKIFYRLGENPQPLIGVAVSKSNFNKAHDRNKAKRLAFQAVEKVYERLLKNLNLVIMPNSKVLSESVDQLIRELENAKDLY